MVMFIGNDQSGGGKGRSHLQRPESQARPLYPLSVGYVLVITCYNDIMALSISISIASCSACDMSLSD